MNDSEAKLRGGILTPNTLTGISLIPLLAITADNVTLSMGACGWAAKDRAKDRTVLK